MIKIDPKLVSGSQWVLSKKPEGSVSTVVCVTNLTIKPDLQEKFPPQVVTITESGKILSHELGSFLSRRDYVGTSQLVADSFQTILAGEPDDEEDDDTLAIDGIPVGNDPAFDAILGGADEGDGEDEGDIIENIEVIPVFLPAEHDGLAMDEHFVSYTEAPGATLGSTYNVLRFSLDETLNLDQVRGIFDPSQDSLNETLKNFVVDSHVERVELLKFNYVGTYLEVDPEGSGTAIVYLSTNSLSVTDEVEEQPVAIPELHVIPQLPTQAVVGAQVAAVTVG